uniref:Uncharacterized protein n=1 Tax=Ditylenchus dipsaci TaxID=166011 RepID=A0A915EQP0_9BILA
MNQGGAAAGGHSNGTDTSESQQHQFNESENEGCNEQKENRRDHGNTTNHSASDSLEGSRTASTTQLNTFSRHSEVFPSQMTASYPSPTQLHTSSSSNLCNTTPLMTSFRELASSESQLCVSGYSDISQLSEAEEHEKKCKVLRLMDSDVGSKPSSASCTPRQTKQQPKSIFPCL